MKILVLGGAGYIGSHTVYRLIEQGNEVIVFDNLETGHVEAIHPQAKFYRGDLRNRADIERVLTVEPDIEAVIHFAANSLVGESMTNPLKYYGQQPMRHKGAARVTCAARCEKSRVFLDSGNLRRTAAHTNFGN